MTLLARSLLLCAVLVVAGCTSAAPAGLDGRTFLSTAVTDGGGARDLVPGTRIRLSFDDGRIGVQAGCNTMGASYRLDGGRLRITDAATTEMGCDPARQAQDDWVFAFLGAGPTVALAGDELTLTAGSTAIRFLDREVAEPDLPLVGTTWTVVSLIGGDAVSSVPQERRGHARVRRRTGASRSRPAATPVADRTSPTRRRCASPISC